MLDPAERKAALLGVIGAAKRRLILSLFRCDDFSVLDALAAALERGCEVEAVLTKRAKGGKKRLKKLWGALEEMGAVVTRYADPVVKYHAKYLVADDKIAIITTLNPTRKCFTRTWDAVLISQDPAVVKGLLTLFKADAAGAAAAVAPSAVAAADRRTGAIARGDAGADLQRQAQHPHPRSQAVRPRPGGAVERAARRGRHRDGARQAADARRRCRTAR